MAALLDRLTQTASHLTTPSSASTVTMAKQARNIVLYTDSTPNGIKASIALEELGLVSS